MPPPAQELRIADGEPASNGVLRVDLSALARNYRHLRTAAAHSRCAAVVKANAYGLGLKRVARRLHREGCETFFVATSAEGISLRSALDRATIYVLAGPSSGEEEVYAAHRLCPVLNSVPQIVAWGQHCDRASRDGAPPLHAALHIDTGMERLGLSRADTMDVAANAHLLEHVTLDFVMTHLACADEPSHELNASQVRLFDNLRAHLPALPTSIGNSAGTLTGHYFQGDLVRPGIALYGGNPYSDRPNPMEVVVQLFGRIIQIRQVSPMSTVGYGATFRMEKGGMIATVGVGYADGYPRKLGNACPAVVNGRLVPVVGRVSMDTLAVDVTGVPPEDLRIGAPVELIGRAIALDRVAQLAGTIANEILTGLGARLSRFYVD